MLNVQKSDFRFFYSLGRRNLEIVWNRLKQNSLNAFFRILKFTYFSTKSNKLTKGQWITLNQRFGTRTKITNLNVEVQRKRQCKQYKSKVPLKLNKRKYGRVRAHCLPTSMAFYSIKSGRCPGYACIFYVRTLFAIHAMQSYSRFESETSKIGPSLKTIAMRSCIKNVRVKSFLDRLF